MSELEIPSDTFEALVALYEHIKAVADDVLTPVTSTAYDRLAHLARLADEPDMAKLFERTCDALGANGERAELFDLRNDLESAEAELEMMEAELAELCADKVDAA